jgi:AbiJ N-terminal domain 3/Abortive infection C-terminus
MDEFENRLIQTTIAYLIERNLHEVASLLVESELSLIYCSNGFSEFLEEAVIDLPISIYNLVEKSDYFKKEITKALNKIAHKNIRDMGSELSVEFRIKLIAIEENWKEKVQDLILNFKDPNQGVDIEKYIVELLNTDSYDVEELKIIVDKVNTYLIKYGFRFDSEIDEFERILYKRIDTTTILEKVVITEITRKSIFDNLLFENISWNGKLDEQEFLSRIFDLSSIPSTDSRFENIIGDIWQHRVNNNDWDENWVFVDNRFNFLYCIDNIFLEFLCQMLHPLVRRDKAEVDRLVQMFNEHLGYDGYELVEKNKISGHSVFLGRVKSNLNISFENRKSELINALSEDYVFKQITLMEGAINNAPYLAIGTAKELIETICKTILTEKEIPFDKDLDLPKLLKETSKELKLTPDGIMDDVKASDTIKKILRSLSTIVQGLSELRNHYGSGHGKDARFKGLNERHAKLAVGAASTLAIFLLETNKIREEMIKDEKKGE